MTPKQRVVTQWPGAKSLRIPSKIKGSRDFFVISPDGINAIGGGLSAAAAWINAANLLKPHPKESA